MVDNTLLNEDDWDDGFDWSVFICSYEYQGARYGFHLVAEDWDDAKSRLASISNGKIDGIIPQVEGKSPFEFAFEETKAMADNPL